LYQPEQPVHSSVQQRYSQPYNGSYGSQPVQTRQYTQPSGRAASSYDTLPPGVAPTYGSADIGSRSATLEAGAKPPIPSKPEKDKKAKHGFFSGIGFGKSKKDKEKDPKKWCHQLATGTNVRFDFRETKMHRNNFLNRP
jgi:hypothetical protein